jgi:hypothetical protein
MLIRLNLEELMKKNKYSFFIMQLFFVAAISSTLILAGCSRTNTGTDPAPPGGEIIFAYNNDLYVEGHGATSDDPLWHDEGFTIVEAYITFKANPDEPVAGATVDFTVSGGGDFYDYDTLERIGPAARVVTNNAGIALVYYYTVGEWETYYVWEEVQDGVWEKVEKEKAVFSNQYITACVDEEKIGPRYTNCRTITVFIDGPEEE